MTDSEHASTDSSQSAPTGGGGDLPVAELLADVWGSIAELCRGLDDEEWARPTACPGWSVQDQLSHLVGPEAAFLGHPQPKPLAVAPPYVRNEFGNANEAAVAWRRTWPPAEVLAEFVSVTEQRLDDLRALTGEDLDEDSWTPTGPGKYRDLLAIRVFDAWVHEQDIRVAVGRPGHLGGPVAAHALGRCFLAMPYIVGKKAAAPEGAVVDFVVEGPTSGSLRVKVEGGRARAAAEPAGGEGASVRVVAEFEAFTRLCCGRITPD